MANTRWISGHVRIALVGSLATDQSGPQDTDLLVTVDAPLDVAPLARAGRRRHLNDDLHVLSLDPGLIVGAPLVLWPGVVRRGPMPDDLEELLLARIERERL